MHSEATAPSEEIADFVTTLSFGDLESDIVRLAERSFLDTIGVLIAGSEDPASTLSAEHTTSNGTSGPATVVGRGVSTDPSAAVLAHGTAAHALDFDDLSWGMDGHPSAPLIAPLLTIAELNDISGETAITGYTAGFETMCYLAAPISPGHYEAGWHATSTFGVFGAAAATAAAMDLSVAETRQAMNIAASMPSGLKRNFGSMTKPLHVGLAARSGLTAAQLAQRGFTADTDTFSGPGGFFQLYGPADTEPDIGALPVLGDDWGLHSHGIHVKKYPCCYFTHTGIYGTAALVEEFDIDTNAIADIEVLASKGAADALAHDDPETPSQAKFSMPYTVSYAAIYGNIGLSAFEEAALLNESVRALAECVHLQVDEGLEYDSHTATVRIETQSGSSYERTVENPPGTHNKPLPDQELHEKFRMCASTIYDDDTVEWFLSRLDTLRQESSLKTITQKL